MGKDIQDRFGGFYFVTYKQLESCKDLKEVEEIIEEQKNIVEISLRNIFYEYKDKFKVLKTFKF